MATLQELETITAEIETFRKRLVEMIAASPELFAKKRSLILHGVKTGFQQRHGSLSWGDDAQLVAAIRFQMPDHFAALVDVAESPNREALAELNSETLVALGIKVNPAGTRVVVRFVETADDKQMSLPLEGGAA